LNKAALNDFMGNYYLTVRFTNARESKLLNTKYRKKNYATNVLTFSYEKYPNVIADIVICLPIIYAECKEQNVGYLDHLTHMIIHGTLHAIGYDHECSNDALIMEKLEEKILNLLSISSPYAQKT
tara:strand:- start:6548 stop:6922 length:375 start_codon:yes stop_codon:yes gene_type:complete